MAAVTPKLRPWTMEDLDTLVEKANNFKIAKNMMNTFPHPYTMEAGVKFIEMVNMMNPLQVFAIDVNGLLGGSIGIFPQTDIRQKNAELGYWLEEPLWGKGIIPMAIKQIVEYGFKTWDIERIFAIPFSTNKGSQRALEKAGFELEGNLKKTIYKNGEYLDELIYAIRKTI